MAARVPTCQLIAYSGITFFSFLLVFAAIMYSVEGANELSELQRASDAWLVDRDERQAMFSAMQSALSVAGSSGGLANLTAFMARLDAAAGEQPDPTAPNWSYIGSVYFAFTVISGIGYGTFTPATTGGKACTISIGLIGIGSLVAFLGGLSKGISLCIPLHVYSTNMHTSPYLYISLHSSTYMHTSP